MVTPHAKPIRAIRPSAAPHSQEEAEEGAHAAHGSSAAKHGDEDEHDAKPAAEANAKSAKADKASAAPTLLDQWPVLTGVAVASTLIGAAISRFAPKHAA